MMERIAGLSEGVDGVRATARLTRRDYLEVLEPIFEEARRAGRRVRLLYQVGPDLERVSAGAALTDAMLVLRYRNTIERCAIVTDVAWIAGLTRWSSLVVPFEVRVFSIGEKSRAADWLVAPGEEATVSHRLLSERGVLVVEPTQPLRKADFEALSRTVDPWIEREGRLHGLVIHTRDFPGWESFGSLVRHVRFVRDHQDHIDRVAVSGDMTMLSKRLARRLVDPEVEQFPFEELDDAVSWASASPVPVSSAH